MDDMDPDDLPELCDKCGTVITEDDELYALVPDSSALHEDDPRLDGKRVLTACSIDHLGDLVEEYRRRPYLDEEQWAGKVCRVLEEQDGEVSLETLALATGLSEQQVDRGVAWHNARARAWQERYGDGCADDREEHA
ncbi:hypothetical protein ACIGXM_09595 [Kitasatospora sp. NPDC052896]|uniref:hypothetical protein n=1 Tax=Kitasatospora sp. NPDC052896 TaxID=3364061 RepID=UPI0037C87A53